MFLRIMLGLLMGVSPYIWAGDLGFATERDEIIEQLSAPKVKPQSRSYGRMRQLVREEVTAPQRVNLKIEFDANVSTLRPQARSVLRALGQALISEQLRTASFDIGGHTDSDGDEAYNEVLSLQRAQAVKRYLIKHFQIAPGRLVALGFGEFEPLLPNNTAANKQINRRVEIRTR